MLQREVRVELECLMEQLSADLIAFDRQEGGRSHTDVPKWDVGPPTATLEAQQGEPRGVARLDLMRKVMLVFAGALTLLWLGFLAWGAVRLVETMIF
jgi:hypothetical protein